MCSISLSGTLLCLTGRLSAFRASVATDPGFIAQIEHDSIKHWLWGRFEMLSGDDKSTWYWLAASGQRMLYIPDAMATTIEVVEESAVRRAWANILRWSGNSLRHSGRAFLLGPAKLGVFPWWTLLDQRVSMWTILLGPLIGLLAVCAGRYELAAGYLLWVLCSRVGHSAMSWRHGRRFSLAYIPLEILSEWAMAVAKIWILFHPARQNWMNRGARTLDSTRQSTLYPLRRGLALYLLCLTCVGIVLAIGMKTGLLPSPRETRLFLNKASAPARVDSAADDSAITKLPEAPHFGDSASAVRDLLLSRGTEAGPAIQMALPSH
jgi:glycosyltransferase Alg8